MEIVKINIEDLKPYKNNAKIHTQEQIEQIKKSIKEFGMNDPIAVWGKDNIIVEGHGRLEALKQLGYTEVDCIRLDHLTDEERKAYTLAHNKLTMNTDFDFDILNEELEDITDIDMSDFGFDLNFEDEEKEVEEDEFDIDSNIPEEPKAKYGDIYQLGKHRLMCGDSTKEDDVEKLMNGNKADMVFTDPPYGMNLDTDFSDMKGLGKGNKYKKVKGDNEDFSSKLITTIFDNYDYCKEIFLWGADYYAELIPNRNNGSWVVWDKQNNGEGCNDAYDKMFGSNFELCWSKNKHKRALARILWKGFFGMENEDTKKRIHPTQKPIKLAKWFLEKFSKENNNIVDLYGGSGSTLICCEQMNRKCFMMEYDAQYIDAIIKRWEDFTGKKAIKIT